MAPHVLSKRPSDDSQALPSAITQMLTAGMGGGRGLVRIGWGLAFTKQLILERVMCGSHLGPHTTLAKGSSLTHSGQFSTNTHLALDQFVVSSGDLVMKSDEKTPHTC